MDKTTPVYKELRKFINTSWGSVGKDGTFPPFFPGPQPISIERRHMNLLNRNEYFACEKTDGTRIATYLMLYDAVIVSGQDLRNMNLMDRLSAIDRFANGVMRVPSDAFQIKLKKFYYMKHMKYLVEMLKNNEFSYATDGVVFTPVYEPIRIGTHDTMFKWKPQEKNTVDFKVKNRPNGEIGLYIQERGELVFESLLKVCNITPEWGKMLHDDAIAECEYQWKQWPRWWKPVGIRTDKTHPNNRRTLHRTMVNIEENIQLHEFIKFEKRG